MKSIVRALVAGAAVAALYSAPAEAMELAGQGPKVGVGWAKLKNGDESDSTLGVALGWALTFEINDQFAFQPEILLNFKGGEYGVGGVTSWEADLSYIECHSLAKFTLADEVPKPVVFAGLSLGINIKDDVTTDPPSPGYDDNDANFMELGYVLGLGVEFPAGNGVVSADIRFTGSITDATDKQVLPGKAVPEMKNRGFMFMFGYRF